MVKFISLLAFSFITSMTFAQVGIGTTNPNTSAVLDLTSTSKGLLPPRMSSTSRQGIISPAEGLIVFDTTEDVLFVFSNGQWRKLIAIDNVAYELPYSVYGAGSTTNHLTGISVCLGGQQGTDAVVGAIGFENGQGRVLRLRKSANNTWYSQQVSPTDLQDGDGFGFAAGIDRLNNSVDFAVGAPFDDSATVTDCGSAYIYAPSSLTTVLRNKILAPTSDRTANARFGRSIDIAANTTDPLTGKGFAIVGAPGVSNGRGSAYIFDYNPNTGVWEYEATLTDNLGSTADSFGLSVSLYYSITGDSAWAFVGAPYDDDTQVDAGSVTVFRKAPGSALWSRVAKIVGTANDHFGYSLANSMRCGWAAIGAAELNTSNGGDVFVAQLTSLSGSVAGFTLSQLTSSNQIGYSLSMMPTGTNCSDLWLLAGTRNGVTGPSTGVNLGMARLFKYNGTSWTTVINQITDPTVEIENEGYGEAVSIHTANRMMLIAAPRQTVNGNVNQGKVEFRKY